MPETLQVTAVLFVPVTLVVNRCCAPAATVALAGNTVTLIDGGAAIVTAAEPDTCRLATDVAFTARVGGFGTEDGAL